MILYKSKVNSNKFTPVSELGLTVSRFPLKIGTNNVNNHYSDNLPSSNIWFNMTVKDFRQVHQPLTFSNQPQMAYVLSEFSCR